MCVEHAPVTLHREMTCQWKEVHYGRGAVSHHCRHAIVSQQGDILEGVRERPEVVRRSWLKEYVPEHRSKMLARVDKMVMGKDEPTWEQSTKHKGFTAGAHFVEFRFHRNSA
jgi:hypothetical protein